jgi:hypothetical protein
MLWFHLLSVPLLHLNSSITSPPIDIGRISWSSSQYLDGFLISTPFPSQYHCLHQQTFETIDCFDQSDLIIQFHLTHETITFFSHRSSFLCLSQLHNGSFLFTDFPDSLPFFCHIKVPLLKQFSLDAHLFVDWKKLSLYLSPSDEIDQLVCSAIATSSFSSSSSFSSTNFFPISLSEQYGNPKGFLYWLDRCGLSSQTTSAHDSHFILVQLWQIDREMLVRSSSPEEPSVVASCPCILRKIIVPWKKNLTLLEDWKTGNCLEELLLTLSRHSSSLSMLSSIGWKELISLKEPQKSLADGSDRRQYLRSQEVQQLIFVLQAFQSANASPSPPTTTPSATSPLSAQLSHPDKLQITSLVRPLLLSLSDLRHGKREYLLFQNSLQSLFFSSDLDEWKLNYLQILSQRELFKEDYLLSERNSLNSAHLFHWISELLFSCQDIRRLMDDSLDSWPIPAPVPHSREVKDPCPTFLLFSPDLFLLFLDLVQALTGDHLPSSTLLNPQLSKELHILRSLLSALQSSIPNRQHFNDDTVGEPDSPASTVSTHESLYNTMILSFVRIDDILEAESFISLWRSSTPTPKHTYSYHIIPIDETTHGCLISYPSPEITTLTTTVRTETNVLIPCHRTVFLTVEQFIDEFSSHQDRVVVLVGIEALRTVVFSQDSSRWHLPNIFITESRHIAQEPTLLYSLIMGLSSFSLTQGKQGNEGEGQTLLSPVADLRIFMGFARDIRLMLTDLRSSPFYTLTDYGPTIAFQLYCSHSSHRHHQQHPSLRHTTRGLHIHIDQRREYFDLRRPSLGSSFSLSPSPVDSAKIEEISHLIVLKIEIIQNNFASRQTIEVCRIASLDLSLTSILSFLFSLNEADLVWSLCPCVGFTPSVLANLSRILKRSSTVRFLIYDRPSWGESHLCTSLPLPYSILSHTSTL